MLRREIVGKVHCSQCHRFFGIVTDDGQACAPPECDEVNYTLMPDRPKEAAAVCPGKLLWQQLKDRVTVRSSGNVAVSRLPGVPSDDAENPSLHNVLRGLEDGYSA